MDMWLNADRDTYLEIGVPAGPLLRGSLEEMDNRAMLDRFRSDGEGEILRFAYTPAADPYDPDAPAPVRRFCRIVIQELPAPEPPNPFARPEGYVAPQGTEAAIPVPDPADMAVTRSKLADLVADSERARRVDLIEKTADDYLVDLNALDDVDTYELAECIDRALRGTEG